MWAYVISSLSTLIPFRSWAYRASRSTIESSEELDSRSDEISEISDNGVKRGVWERLDSPQLEAELGLLSSIPQRTFSSLAVTIVRVVLSSWLKIFLCTEFWGTLVAHE